MFDVHFEAKKYSCYFLQYGLSKIYKYLESSFYEINTILPNECDFNVR